MEQERKVYNTRPDGEIGSDEKTIYVSECQKNNII